MGVAEVVDVEVGDAPADDDRESRLLGDRARLVLLSFLLLFLELAIIRWSGSNVVYLSYFSNFVLLGSFLGVGVGFLRARAKVNLFPFAPIVLVALVAFIRFFPAELRSSRNDFLYFGEVTEKGPPREIVLAVIFLTVAAVMAFIGQGVARAFARFDSLEAYKLDLCGSLLGVVGISAIAFLGAPPLVWGAVGAVLLGVLVLDEHSPTRAWLRIAQGLALVGLVVLLAAESFTAGFTWSPYYKIEETKPKVLAGATAVSVNGVPHQANLPVSDNPLYNLVYDHLVDPEVRDVLVIGAGGGNDVAVALARGARRVDAVEIDPKIFAIGKRTHPDRPYEDDRVHRHIDDGRAYLEGTDRKYDVIVLALTDSITLVPGQSSVRLESFLFTKQAIEQAKAHLKPGGVFTMYNYYRQNWLVDRYARTLDEVFGRRPCLESLGTEARLAILVTSRQAASIACDTLWKASVSNVPSPATDDYPFPYLRNRSIPTFYLATIALILLVSLSFVRVLSGRLRSMVPYVDLFFMGAAFLLLETKNVVQFALLFGTTWFVNSLVFAGVLLSVLAAVVLSQHVTFRRRVPLYLVLLGALVVAGIVPVEWLLGLPPVPRFFVAVTIAFAPIFIANLVFSQRFKDVGSSTTAFGANLLGAMVGGCLEYLALVTGYNALLVMVALLYGLAFVFGRRYSVRGSTA